MLVQITVSIKSSPGGRGEGEEKGEEEGKEKGEEGCLDSVDWEWWNGIMEYWNTGMELIMESKI